MDRWQFIKEVHRRGVMGSNYYLHEKEKSMHDPQTPMSNETAEVNSREVIQRHLNFARHSLTERLSQLNHLEQRLSLFDLTNSNELTIVVRLINQIADSR